MSKQKPSKWQQFILDRIQTLQDDLGITVDFATLARACQVNKSTFGRWMKLERGIPKQSSYPPVVNQALAKQLHCAPDDLLKIYKSCMVKTKLSIITWQTMLIKQRAKIGKSYKMIAEEIYELDESIQWRSVTIHNWLNKPLPAKHHHRYTKALNDIFAQVFKLDSKLLWKEYKKQQATKKIVATVNRLFPGPTSPWQTLVANKREKEEIPWRKLAELVSKYAGKEIPYATLNQWVNSSRVRPVETSYTPEINKGIALALNIDSDELHQAYLASSDLPRSDTYKYVLDILSVQVSSLPNKTIPKATMLKIMANMDKTMQKLTIEGKLLTRENILTNLIPLK